MCEPNLQKKLMAGPIGEERGKREVKETVGTRAGVVRMLRASYDGVLVLGLGQVLAMYPANRRPVLPGDGPDGANLVPRLNGGQGPRGYVSMKKGFILRCTCIDEGFIFRCAIIRTGNGLFFLCTRVVLVRDIFLTA